MLEKDDLTDSWYASWFDTQYYHILYSDRDHQEAFSFVKTLTASLDLNTSAKVLDLACGRGRHSVYFAKLGFDTTGVDLSPASIAFAKANKPKASELKGDLRYDVHNMTKPMNERYDLIVNLFTSFGYFEHERDNLETLKAIKTSLSTDGMAVIDFLNVPYILANLKQENTKTVKGITFHLRRQFKDGYIYKNIAFEVDGHPYRFTERVRALTLNDFSSLFEEAGLTLNRFYGDYDLSEYDAETSPRLIMLISR